MPMALAAWSAIIDSAATHPPVRSSDDSQAEDHDRCAAEKWNRAATVAARRGDVLLAPMLIRHDPACQGATCIEAVQLLPVASIEHEEVTIQVAGKEHVSCGRSDRRVHRRGRLDSPEYIVTDCDIMIESCVT